MKRIESPGSVDFILKADEPLYQQAFSRNSPVAAGSPRPRPSENLCSCLVLMEQMGYERAFNGRARSPVEVIEACIGKGDRGHGSAAQSHRKRSGKPPHGPAEGARGGACPDRPRVRQGLGDEA